MEKLVEIGILFDFYGRLLSKRQYLAVEFYYVHDLTLGEIGEELDITRQGVFDTLKRAEQKLYKYETELGLVKKFYDSHESLEEIIMISNEIMDLANKYDVDEIYNRSLRVKEIGKKILNKNREVME
ncbi:MAG: sigma factor-like helix-turn-helix DNA-binding protein [Tissierellaceae bacterium]